MTDIEERLDAIESRIAIEQLISNYTHAFDRRDRTLLASLWHDDASFSLGEIGGPFHGPDGIVEGAETLWSANAVMHHWMANVVISVDGEHGTARSAVDVMVANVDDGPTQVGGLYVDSRRRGEWKFSTREFTADYWVPLTEWKPTLGIERETILATMQ